MGNAAVTGKCKSLKYELLRAFLLVCLKKTKTSQLNLNVYASWFTSRYLKRPDRGSIVCLGYCEDAVNICDLKHKLTG